MILLDFQCPTHGLFESLEPRPAPDYIICPDCLTVSPLVLSPVRGRVKRGEVSRGKYNASERPPGYLNTEALGDGMPMEEWAAKTDKETMDMHLKAVRSKA